MSTAAKAFEDENPGTASIGGRSRALGRDESAEIHMFPTPDKTAGGRFPHVDAMLENSLFEKMGNMPPEPAESSPKAKESVSRSFWQWLRP